MPLVGLLAVIFWPQARQQQIKWVALFTAAVTFGLSLVLLASFDTRMAGPQHEHMQAWLAFGKFKIAYDVAVDGISILLVMLTTIIMPLAILFSLENIKEKIRLYYSFMMIIEFAMIGVFVAQDLFLFYVFWEVSLVPMYFLIGIWGSENRIFAALKFFIYTTVGSLLMLLAILYVGNHFGSFNIAYIVQQVQDAATKGIALYPSSFVEALLFGAFFLAFAIKVPIWPLHSWLPDAHVQAPTAGSVILAGVMLKLGTYGLLRFCIPFFPHAAVAFAPFISVLAVIGILYGAWVSFAQTDIKKLVAYSSISHLGFVVLGLFSLTAAGMSGAVLQMVNHGISTGGLFLLIGMLYERRHTKAMEAFGGLWKVMPIFSGLSLVIFLSSMGLPGLNGFVGEFTILLGTFGSPLLGGVFAVFATIGVILAAVYLLQLWNNIFMGEVKWQENLHLPPIRWSEYTALAIVVILALIIGLYPKPFFGAMDATTGQVSAQAQRYIAQPVSVQAAQAPAAQVPIAQAPTAQETK